MVHTSIVKALRNFMVKKPVQLKITEQFLNTFDYKNFFPKEHLLISLDTSISRNIIWDMMVSP